MYFTEVCYVTKVRHCRYSTSYGIELKNGYLKEMLGGQTLFVFSELTSSLLELISFGTTRIIW